MIDHQVNRHNRVDLRRVATQTGHCRTQRGQVHQGGHAGEVLQDHAGGEEGQLPPARRSAVPVGQGQDVLAGDHPAVLFAQQRFEQDPDRERQAVDIRQAVLLKPVQAVIAHGSAAAGCQRSARPKSVRNHAHPSSPRCAAGIPGADDTTNLAQKRGFWRDPHPLDGPARRRSQNVIERHKKTPNYDRRSLFRCTMDIQDLGRSGGRCPPPVGA